MAKYLSENAFTRYKLRVELTLVTVLHRRELCDQSVVDDVATACDLITTQDIYDEEGRIKHDIRAMVNEIQKRVEEVSRPYVHLGATSFDIVDTANAARYRDAIRFVLLPELLKLEKVLIDLANKEAATIQIGRTHGQHAVPITFGHTIAEYVNRLGLSVQNIKQRADELPGKFSGAVGGYNSSSLFFDDPIAFEREVLSELGLKPLKHSTQIVEPEPLLRLISEVVIAAGIIANAADDMRHLQRTEIGEVGEPFEAEQVGSSTMPQKQNPINFENVKSIWKVVMPRIITMYMDQICEHQRDLTNSASGRTVGEVIAYVGEMAKRMARVMGKLQVNLTNLSANLIQSEDSILAEPLYLLLAAFGHPDAHEAVRKMTIISRTQDKTLHEVFYADENLASYRARMTDEQQRILSDPRAYTGQCETHTREITAFWQSNLDDLKLAV